MKCLDYWIGYCYSPRLSGKWENGFPDSLSYAAVPTDRL